MTMAMATAVAAVGMTAILNRRRFSADDEPANVENAFLRRKVGALRVERNPHFAADDLGVDVVEAEEGTGVIGLEDDELALGHGH